jgi:hypothetical protein
MRPSVMLSAALGALLVAGAALAGDLKSGPPEGKNIPGPFHPLHASGPDAGKKVCLV